MLNHVFVFVQWLEAALITLNLLKAHTRHRRIVILILIYSCVVSTRRWSVFWA